MLFNVRCQAWITIQNVIICPVAQNPILKFLQAGQTEHKPSQNIKSLATFLKQHEHICTSSATFYFVETETNT